MFRLCLLAIIISATVTACNPITSSQPQHTVDTSEVHPSVDQMGAPPGTGRLVVLMVTDNTDHQQTGSASIAIGTTENAKLMDGFFHQVKSGAGMDVDMHTIAGSPPPNDPFNCKNVVDSIKKLPVNPGDAVMIYYAGHGTNIGNKGDLSYDRAMLHAIAPPEFTNGPVTQFPFIACGTQLEDMPNLDMIATWLASKKPRLTIVMADACNSYLPLTGPPAESFYAAAAAVVVPEARLRSLFRDASGTVLIAGAQPGHYSYYFTDPKGTTGGVLTLKFIKAISGLPINSPTNWQSVGGNLGFEKIPRSPSLADDQTPLLRVGAPFETAVPLSTAARDTQQVGQVEIAQATPSHTDSVKPPPSAQETTLSQTRLKQEQVAPGTSTGTDPGPAPAPVPPASNSGFQAFQPNSHNGASRP